ncbi:Methyltransferase type 11 [Methylobacterium sp. 4-46]|uniref:class I SAM-dependent methyltransferase n=1 Tax=unclassified Methylobacterium TaxID=2615210 RepID=UPI000165CA7A|nr:MULTISPECIES: methyltransferase domain-containing protein [Methylobacterium]ACA18586.1 Methyltransferase type 11 [Methylobacterium sp. 4-46]WFT77868.1 methyltransferase domain-containing protein [Methylobacterium nodulans]
MLFRKRAPALHHGFLDKVQILHRAVYIEGWANALAPSLRYEGRDVALQVGRVARPDLVPIFGPDALMWGFVAVGLLPTDQIDGEKLRFEVSPGVSYDNPATHFPWSGDAAFDAMQDRFRAEVASRKGRFLEIGSRARSGTVYRDAFPQDIAYVGLDITAGPNVDVVGDAHHLSRCVEGPFDFVFSIAVFEHILMPWKVALEMNKVMRPGGLALIISHGAWPLHEEPWDFWRYSKEAWRGVFNRHTGFEMLEAQYKHPGSIVPHQAGNAHFYRMSLSMTYLLSGCLVRKVADPLVAWEAETGEVYDLAYAHA